MTKDHGDKYNKMLTLTRKCVPAIKWNVISPICSDNDQSNSSVDIRTRRASEWELHNRLYQKHTYSFTVWFRLALNNTSFLSLYYGNSRTTGGLHSQGNSNAESQDNPISCARKRDMTFKWEVLWKSGLWSAIALVQATPRGTNGKNPNKLNLLNTVFVIHGLFMSSTTILLNLKGKPVLHLSSSR